MTAPRLRLGTRGSPLALAQAAMARAALAAAWPDMAGAIEIVPIRTTGDVVRDRPLAEIGGKGLFVKELEEALIDRRIDAAVHSMKDVPSILPPGFAIAAVLPRADPRDALVVDRSRVGAVDGLGDLPPGTVVGTCAPRRAAQILRRRPDCRVVDLRGNVETRLRKLEGGDIQATILAIAGLTRLGLADRADHVLEPDEMLPAAAQGAIGLEIRDDDDDTRARVAAIDAADAHAAVGGERAMLALLGGSCRTPVGGYARPDPAGWRLDGLLALPDGSDMVEAGGVAADPIELGRALGEELRRRGGSRFLPDLT